MHGYVLCSMVDPMVRPPPETLEDLEDLTGEPEEVLPPSATNSLQVSPADKKKVHCVAPYRLCLEI